MRARLNEAISLLRTDDPKRVGEAIALLQGTVFAFSMKVCGHHEDAEDTMQEVLFRSLPYLRKIDNPRALAVWLYTVTRNRCWRSRRKSSFAPKQMLSLDELMPDRDELQRLLQDRSPGPEASTVRGEEAQLLHKAVLQLPPPYRIVLVLHDMEELDTDLVAQILNLQPGTVRVRLHRARLAVRKILARLLDGHTRSSLAEETVLQEDRPRRERAKAGRRDPQCRAIFANLSEYLDRQLDQAACKRMQHHMETCPACVLFLNDLSSAIDRCRQFEAPQNSRVEARLGSLLVQEYLRLAEHSPRRP